MLREADPLQLPETGHIEKQLHVEGTVEYRDERTNGRRSIYRIRRRPRRPSLARRVLRALESLIRAARRRK